MQMSNRRLVTATCASCGKEFTGIRNLNENAIYCCCVKCSGAYRKSADLHARREKRAYIPVKILIKRGLDVYPELAPTVGRVYDAERHEGQRAPGYVITSGGKRINVRADECREI